jgi:hypothetical protein
VCQSSIGHLLAHADLTRAQFSGCRERQAGPPGPPAAMASISLDVAFIEAQLSCPVCSHLFGPDRNSPFSTTCGHLLCGECLLMWLKEHRTCPVCRTQLAAAPARSFAVEQFMGGLLPLLPGPGDAADTGLADQAAAAASQAPSPAVVAERVQAAYDSHGGVARANALLDMLQQRLHQRQSEELRELADLPRSDDDESMLDHAVTLPVRRRMRMRGMQHPGNGERPAQPGAQWLLGVQGRGQAAHATHCAALRCAALRCAALRCAALRCAALPWHSRARSAPRARRRGTGCAAPHPAWRTPPPRATLPCRR